MALWGSWIWTTCVFWSLSLFPSHARCRRSVKATCIPLCFPVWMYRQEATSARLDGSWYSLSEEQLFGVCGYFPFGLALLHLHLEVWMFCHPSSLNHWIFGRQDQNRTTELHRCFTNHKALRSFFNMLWWQHGVCSWLRDQGIVTSRSCHKMRLSLKQCFTALAAFLLVWSHWILAATLIGMMQLRYCGTAGLGCVNTWASIAAQIWAKNWLQCPDTKLDATSASSYCGSGHVIRSSTAPPSVDGVDFLKYFYMYMCIYIYYIYIWLFWFLFPVQVFLSLVVVRGLHIAVASLVAKHGP